MEMPFVSTENHPKKSPRKHRKKTSKKNEVDIESAAIIHLATLRIPPEIPPNPP